MFTLGNALGERIVTKMGKVAAQVTGSAEEGEAPWMAGSSCSLTVGMCLHLLTYPCTASMLPQLHEGLLSWIYRSDRRGDARTREGPHLPCLICSYLSSPALPALDLPPGLIQSFSPIQSAWWPGPGSSLALSGRCPISLEEGMPTPMETGSLIA